MDTPYNLYIHKGLPPTPIANPGSTALSAAMNPNDTAYYYYALGKDGKHHFSATLAEHNAFVGSSEYAGKKRKAAGAAGSGRGYGAAENVPCSTARTLSIWPVRISECGPLPETFPRRS